MTPPDPNDALTHSLELLVRGHRLYAGDALEPSPAQVPEELYRRAQRQLGLTARDGQEVPLTIGMANGLRRTAAAEAGLATVLGAARTDHTVGRHATRRLLDDALDDWMPAADTPLGRREAVRRMAARLRMQQRHIQRSHRRSLLHAHRIRRLGYLRRGCAPQLQQPSKARVLPLGAVRYDRSFASGHVRKRVADALDHLGIIDPAARGNWLRGYETLIARESGGRPSAVASEPATAPGAPQPDGHGLGYARGITQTVPTTFARYHQPGTSTNIYDPVANICASMNYVIRHYGVAVNGENLAALVQQADARRAPKGY